MSIGAAPKKTFLLRARFVIGALLCVLGVVITPGSGSGQTLDSAVNSLLADLRAQGAEVGVGSASPGAHAGDVRLGNLTIVFPHEKNQGGVELNIAKLDLSGVRLDAMRIAIDQAQGEGLRLTFDGGKTSIARLTLSRLSLPRSVATGKGDHPFQSLVGALKQASMTEFQDVTLDDVRVEHPFGSAATISASRIGANDFKNGEIARIVISQPRRSEDSSDRVVAAAEIAIETLSPMRLVESLGSGPPDAARDWKSLADAVNIKDFVQTEKPARTAIEQIQLSGLLLRRFAGDPSKLFNLAASSPVYFKDHPDEARQFGEALMDVVKLDQFKATKLTGTDGKEQDPRQFSIESVVVEDLDPLRANAITLDNIQDHRGAIGISVGGASFTKLELVNTGGETVNGAAPAKAPFLGGVSIYDVKSVQPVGAIELRAFDWSASERVGIVPTRLDATISGLSFPPALVPDPGLRESLIKSEVKTLVLDAAVSGNWDEVREQINLDHASLGISNLGKIEMSGTFLGIPKSALESAGKLQAAASAGSVQGLRLKFTDAGLANRLIDVIAAANKQPPEQIRKALTANMPTILGAIADAPARNSLIFALVGFVNEPQTLEMESLAQAPVPVVALVAALRASPSALPGLLKLNAKATHKR